MGARALGGYVWHEAWDDSRNNTPISTTPLARRLSIRRAYSIRTPNRSHDRVVSEDIFHSSDQVSREAANLTYILELRGSDRHTPEAEREQQNAPSSPVNWPCRTAAFNVITPTLPTPGARVTHTAHLACCASFTSTRQPASPACPYPCPCLFLPPAVPSRYLCCCTLLLLLLRRNPSRLPNTHLLRS